MANPIMAPMTRLAERWRTARSIEYLDTHLLNDVGFQVEKNALSCSVYDKQGRYVRRVYK
jgi:hypothetical protein